jgi:Homeobox KN domain
MVRQWIDELHTRPEFGGLDLRAKMLTEFIRNQEKKFQAAWCLADELGDDSGHGVEKDIEFVFVDKSPLQPSSAQQRKSICQFYDLLHPVLAPQSADKSSDFPLISQCRSPQSQLNLPSGSEASSPSNSLLRDDLCSSASSRTSPDVESSSSIAVKETSCPTTQNITTDPNSPRDAVTTTVPTTAIDLTLADSPFTTNQSSSTNPIFLPIQDDTHSRDSTPHAPSVRGGGPPLPSENVSNTARRVVRYSSGLQPTTTPPNSPRYNQLAEDFEMLDVSEDNNEDCPNNELMDGLSKPVVAPSQQGAKLSASLKYAQAKPPSPTIQTDMRVPMTAPNSYIYYLQTIAEQRHQNMLSREAELMSALVNRPDLAVSEHVTSAGRIPVQAPLVPRSRSRFINQLRNCQASVLFNTTSLSKSMEPIRPESPEIKSMNPDEMKAMSSLSRSLRLLCNARLRLHRSLDSAHQRKSPNTYSLRRRKMLEKSDSTSPLKSWYLANLNHPYPSRQEKIRLAEAGGLTVEEVTRWFLNARLRVQKGISIFMSSPLNL